VIVPQPGAARYERLAALLRAQILAGELVPGDRLPAETRLMFEHDMARQSVVRALDILRAEGLVETINGRGVVVKAPPEKTRVVVPRGARLDGKPLTPEEARREGVTVGSWAFVVTIGGASREYPQETTYLSFS